MNKIHQTIKSFLEEYELDKPDLIYLVAFSGGFDSMCILDCLRRLVRNRIIAIHLNHKWRGEESDREETNCKNFCKTIGVEFYSEDLPPEIPHTETAAREARYEFFEKCAKIFQSRTIFTAHNKNDNAETLLYRMAMGTGINGMQGISEHRKIFYRPLLSIPRSEIEVYCKKNNLNPNSDSSNTDTKYKRNFIRQKLLPQILEINPNAIEAINSLSQIAQEETKIINEYLKIILNKITENGKIKTKKFLSQSLEVQNRIIYDLFIRYNLEYDRKRIQAIHDFINKNQNSKSGKTCSLTDNLWIFTSEKYIEIITKDKITTPNILITKEGRYENNGYIFELEKFEKPIKRFPQDNENTAYVNLSRLNSDLPLEIRARQDGDFIHPFGAKGSQKLKKYLNAKKIANHEKDTLLFLVQEKEILWAIGLGISDKIKVTDKPTHRLKFAKPSGNAESEK